MTKQWRKEIRELKSRQKLIWQNSAALTGEADKVIRAYKKEIANIFKLTVRNQKQAARAAQRLERRIAILQGRLS